MAIVMRVAVSFQDEQLDLEVSEEALIAAWHGPKGASPHDAARMVLEALEHPRQYPPLRQALVPGDRVVIAWDPEIPDGREVLGAICRTLAEVEVGTITVLVPAGGRGIAPGDLPEGVTLVAHDPDDRNQLAYLANTTEGRRVYLNRLATDADFVLPVGRLGHDPAFGDRGPWSTLFPGLSDAATLHAFQASKKPAAPSREKSALALSESAEVSWLLGCQFQVGIVPGVEGTVEVVAGVASVVLEEGRHAADRAWRFRPESRAELVVAGVGRPGVPTRIEDLVEGLATAARLVRRGGKIVALSRAEGSIGPALRRLKDAEDPRGAPSILRGLESEPDYETARLLAATLAWADVYLLSALGQDDTEDLWMIALDRPEEARRLVAGCGSCIVLSQAELTQVDVPEDS